MEQQHLESGETQEDFRQTLHPSVPPIKQSPRQRGLSKLSRLESLGKKQSAVAAIREREREGETGQVVSTN